jgi:hypothetical protein
MMVLSGRASDARRMVYCCRKKITMSDHFYLRSNLQA